MLKNKIKINRFAIIVSFINLVLYHLPVFKFTTNNINYKSLNGVLLIGSLAILIFVLNAFVFYIGLTISRRVGKFLLVFFAIGNSIALYFINTYSVIIDKSMIGNVLNTNYEESSAFFSFTLIVYIVFLGIIPSIFIVKTKLVRVKIKKFFVHIILTFIFILTLVYINSSNWLWIDKNSKSLGALVMPWSYVVNTSRFYYHKNQENKQEILLPNATIKNNEKSIAVLVIGESARSANFSLYGYEKETTPLLSKINNIHAYKANSCATYTTAGVKCILEHKESNKLYEILPNYLFRNDVEVIWRTSNWGEPPVHIKNYIQGRELKKDCEGEGCNYDEVLLSGLNEQLLASKKNKILVVLHTSTSHGPTYYKKYPSRFNKFTPICKSVELGNCSQEELVNAYDNTILYTDYILSTLINQLKELKEYKSTMLYVSDHGESLGESNLYMHGIPASIAPKEQLEIPFIVWLSDNSKELKKNEFLSQQNVFHSVLDFLAIESPIYDENKSIFK
ncbi:phosphoethanolamine--lipid A transferase EptA [Polaribacter cellanae]|uniref:Phosphoethanolamine--lipid A transferase EptA n=1 Tax=Polaribacter cellanae TaxID=2818493 RepID=A0A975H6X3_9FLAO|nr:phosphoethanolamine--lipid A transferase EptA [Polaribacter cellanae]QTE22877.1 phosphoethanolamine--lipid A transferase EptA [Polaribacter cellanae]